MTSTADAMAARLCSACGMCCNGVLFQIVRVQPEDSTAELAALGLKLRRKHKEPYFVQPCPAYQDAQCTIYAERPTRCRQFECYQLKRVASGEITEAIALGKIQEARRRVAQVEALLPPETEVERPRDLTTRYELGMAELTIRPAGPEVEAQRAQLKNAMQELQTFLEQDFRKKTNL
jgi:uncharacterized protein